MIKSFPKIWNLGEPFIKELYDGDVEITEKIDGSQFGFGITPNGDIVMRSKGKEQYKEQCDKMFNLATEQVFKREKRLLEFPKGTYFYGEYLNKPHHNVLSYERTPKDNIIIFGVQTPDGSFVSKHSELKWFSDEMEFEIVPLLKEGVVSGIDELKQLLETPSILGNCKIEGFVIKNYNKFTPLIGGTSFPCFGKYVSEAFKEKHNKEWVSGKDKITEFIDSFRSEARWNKAVQHLKEKGLLTNSPKDIPLLFKEIHIDLVEEEERAIKEDLYKLYIDSIKRKACGGFPEWYKEKLMKQSVEG